MGDGIARHRLPQQDSRSSIRVNTTNPITCIPSTDKPRRWAWQNTHLTRHVSSDSRLTVAKATTRISPKTGRTRRRPARPRMSLTDRLANLHLLLKASSFERWPLNVTFYTQDVFRIWERWSKQHFERLRPGIRVSLDSSVEQTTKAAYRELLPAEPPPSDAKVGIQALDVTYLPLKPHLTKSQSLFDNGEWLNCAICKKGVPPSGAMTLVCPHESCHALSHIECASTLFLESNKTNALLPTSGSCASCRQPLQWIDLVKELSLRMRGESEIATLFKKRRTRNSKGGMVEEEVAATEDEDEGEEEDDDLPRGDGAEDDEDEWHLLPESSDVEVQERPTSFRAAEPRITFAEAPPPAQSARQAEPVIEDSDWDEAEVLS